MESLNFESSGASPDSTSTRITPMIQMMETLTLVSEPGSPFDKPRSSSTGTSSTGSSISDECGGWYPISNPWKRNHVIGHQVRFLLEFVDWEQKKMRCEQLHAPPTKCEILPLWAAGTRHLIRRAQFEDGTSWVLKIPFPENISEEDDELTLECLTKSNLGKMRLEYETTLTFQDVCDVRVPKFYAIDDGSNKPFPPPHTRYEAPCIYMEYLDGMTATDRIAAENPPPETISFLHKQLAQIVAMMMSVACPAAGSIGIDSETGKLGISPSNKAGCCYFETPKAFYKNLGQELFKDQLASEEMGPEVTAKSLALLQKFHSLYAILAPQDSFCLVNDDLGFHNFLTNENWEITAVIDVDCVYAGPWSWALKPLCLSWMDVQPDSLFDTFQPFRNRRPGSKEAFSHFLREIGAALREQGNESLAREAEKFLKSGGRELVLGLEAYQSPDHDLHMAWLGEYAGLSAASQNQTNPSKTT